MKLVPVYATVCTIKEIYRALKISKGLKEGASFKADSIFIPVLIATIKVHIFKVIIFVNNNQQLTILLNIHILF